MLDAAETSPGRNVGIGLDDRPSASSAPDVERTWLDRERTLLEEAGAVSAQARRSLQTTASLPALIVDQIQTQMDALDAAALQLHDLAHDMVFVGPVGSGKSTLLSMLAGLTLADGDVPEGGGSALERRSVLASSAGRTSVCPLRIEHGEFVAVSLEPMAAPEVEGLAREYVQELWSAKSAQDGVASGTLVPEETARALRNMAGFSNRKLTTLMRDASGEKEFADRFVASMKLDRRTRIHFDMPADAPRGWLKRTLSDINSGRCAEATLPHLVRVETPTLGISPGLRIALVDSKGTEGTQVRRDVRRALADERTIVVACSSFASCPDEAAQGLVEHARDVAGMLSSGRLCVLGLAKNGEAASVRDEFGDPVEDAQDGHRVRCEQAFRVLKSLSPQAPVEILSIDAGVDDPAGIRGRLGDIVLSLRSRRAAEVIDLTAGLKHMIANAGSELVAMLAPVLKSVRELVDDHSTFDRELPSPGDLKPITAAGARHASTVWATTRRAGDYEILNVHDAVADAYAKAALTAADSFRGRLSQALQTHRTCDHASVKAVIARLLMEASRMPKAVAAAVQREVATFSMSTLGRDDALWSRCSGLWGHPDRRDGPYVSYVVEAVGARLSRDEKFEVDVRRMVDGIWKSTAVDPLRRACAVADRTGFETPVERRSPRLARPGGLGPTAAISPRPNETHHFPIEPAPLGPLEQSLPMGEFFDALLDAEESVAYFSSRPAGSRARSQSRPLAMARFLGALDACENAGDPSAAMASLASFGLGLDEERSTSSAPDASRRLQADDPEQAIACFERIEAFMNRRRMILGVPDLDTLLHRLRSIDGEQIYAGRDEWIQLLGERMRLYWDNDYPMKFWAAGPLTAVGLTLPTWCLWSVGGSDVKREQVRFIDATSAPFEALATIHGAVAGAGRSISRAFIDRRVLQLARCIVEEASSDEVPPFPVLPTHMSVPPSASIPMMGGLLHALVESPERVNVPHQMLMVTFAGREIELHVSGIWLPAGGRTGEPVVSSRRKQDPAIEQQALDIARGCIHQVIAEHLVKDDGLRELATRYAAMMHAWRSAAGRRMDYDRIAVMRARIPELRTELERIDGAFAYPCPS